MKQQVNSNYEEIQESFFERIASEIVYGKKKHSLSSLFKGVKFPIFKISDSQKKELDEDELYSNVFKVLLHNASIYKSQKYFDKLITKIYFYDDWQSLFKQEILKAIDAILHLNNKKKHKNLYLNFYRCLNEEKKYFVEDIYIEDLSLFSLLLSKNNNDGFIDFIDEVISPIHYRRLVEYKDGTSFKNFIREMKNLCFDLYEEEIRIDNVKLPLYESEFMKNLNFECWLVFHNGLGYSHLKNEIVSNVIKDYDFLIKILSKFFYILFLKTTLKKGVLDLSKFDIPSGIIGLKSFDEDEYKTYKNNISYKPKKKSSFNFTRKPEDLKNLYQFLIDESYIKEISFDDFSLCFSGQELQKPHLLEWNKTKVLLAYFINSLRENDFINFADEYWQKTAYCFKNINADSLKSSFSINQYPKGFEEIQSFFDNY
ncbi:hypothetical protein [Cloacibacterium sp.]|uniref:hypothetical protein n=1 Tax=Cloacibacterium sp. TaxID=1913682 RepID=UPI0035B2D51B